MGWWLKTVFRMSRINFSLVWLWIRLQGFSKTRMGEQRYMLSTPPLQRGTASRESSLGVCAISICLFKQKGRSFAQKTKLHCMFALDSIVFFKCRTGYFWAKLFRGNEKETLFGKNGVSPTFVGSVIYQFD